MSFFDKLGDFFKEHWKHILILILIFFVAFGFRTMILRYDLMFEFDSYWHARMNAELIDTGVKPTIDTMGTYHNANTPIIPWSYAPVLYYTGYLAYKIVYLGAPYDQEKWIFLVRLLPAIFGGLIALAAYLLFKWGFNSRKIGYIAGFITAVMPAFIYRQMGGFYEEDCYGFLWAILGFAFLIKALKEPKFTKANIIYATLSGLMFGVMAFTWAVFVIVPVIIEAYFVFMLIWSLITKVDKKIILSICGLFAITFVLTAIFGSLAQTGWIDLQINYGKGILGISKESVNTQKSGVLSSKSVGEESMGKYAFTNKYGVFLAFIILGLIAIIYSLYKNKNIQFTLLTLAWGLVTFYLAWNKLKATYWFGLGLAIVSAFTIAILIKYYQEEKVKTGWKVFGIALSVLLLLGGTASGVIFTYNHAPNIVTEQGWKDAVYFMDNNLPHNSNVFNWWSWGHWITFIGHQRASTDNTNSDQQANGDFGTFFVTQDSNEALGIIKAYDADYIAFDYKALLETQTYSAYANELQKNKFNTKNSFVAPFACQSEQNPIGGTTNFNCTSLFYMGGQRVSTKFDAGKMFGFPSQYTTKPTDIWQNKLPVIYYTTINKSLLLIVDMKTNESYGLKLWFNAPETKKYFIEVYNNGFVRIWKVNKDAFKDVSAYMTGKTVKEVEEWNSKLWWLNDTNTLQN